MLSTIIASVLIFGLLIFVHELGHYLAAKRAGIKVLEFALGFGKELIAWEKGDTRYTLRFFPLGGFCRLLGEDPDDRRQEGNFQDKSIPSRFAVIAAGPVMNFALAVLLFTLMYFFFLGVPQQHSTRIGEVISGSRAQQAGLQSGDVILSVDGVDVQNWQEVVSRINASPEREILLHLRRNGEEHIVSVTPAEQQGKGLIGITPVYKKFMFLPSMVWGFNYTWFFIKLIFVSFYQMITGAIPADVAGPVGIVAVVGEVMQTGLSNLFSLAAIISINLGIINLLPIPALDGSRLLFLTLEGIRGKPIDPQKEGFIHFIGFAVLIMLMIFISFQDIFRLL
ncbi:MAG: RIP metalloprotease RseP [Bacillota bacterium]